MRREGAITIIRPLLHTWRAEILRYAGDRDVRFRIDRSNRDTRFLRNKLRHRLIRYLERSYNPNVKEVLNLGVFISRGRHICVELITEFEALGDYSGASSTQWKKGNVRIMNQCVLYDLDEKGKFKRIRIFHHRHLDPKTVKLH